MLDFNIVVLGCNGMLGRDLMELFTYEKVNVRGYTHEECDITDFDQVENILGSTCGSVSHVINCAAFTNIEMCEEQQEKAFKVNAEAVKFLSQVCLKEQIHLTHISTDLVFEGLKKEPYIEQDETNPLCVYGKSKLEGENHVKSLGGKGLVIRTSWLYGKHGKNFIDTILNKLELAVRVKVTSEQIGSPTYTMDLANVIIQLVMNSKSGVFHVCNKGYCSKYDFAVKAAQIMKFNTDYIIPSKEEDMKLKAETPKFSALSTIRLEKTLPEPVRSWEEGLYQYLIETKKLYEY